MFYLLQSRKTFATLKSFQSCCISTINIYHTSIPSRLAFNRGPTIKYDMSTTSSSNSLSDNQTKFADLNLHPHTLKALHEDFGYTFSTEVQERVISTTNNLLVRAKTGTGKTLAFTILALEKVKHFSSDRIPILIMSPTRELAIQITNEVKKLSRHHRLNVETMVGGTNRTKSIQSLLNKKIDIIVATPGRLNDVLKSEQRVRQKLQGLEVLVFDEADQLLDMGFQREVEAIVSMLPPQRHTLMFSATVSPAIKSIANKFLGQGFVHIDCVPKNEIETHMKIKQSYVVVPYKQQIYLLQEILAKHKESTPHAKVILFLPTSSSVIYLTKLLSDIQSMDVLQIHSRLDQKQRSRVSDNFRRSRSSILCTTDVSARGVDYPSVTLVIQLGLPSNREQYIHRIGRTGRAGKEGAAILVLSPFEERYLELIKDLPVRQDLRFNLGPNKDKEVEEVIKGAIARTDMDLRRKVFGSMLGFQISSTESSKIRKETACEASIDFAKGCCGFESAPSISSKLAQTLGITRVTGINISRSEYSSTRSTSNSSFGRGIVGDGRREGDGQGTWFKNSVQPTYSKSSFMRKIEDGLANKSSTSPKASTSSKFSEVRKRYG